MNNQTSTYENIAIAADLTEKEQEAEWAYLRARIARLAQQLGRPDPFELARAYRRKVDVTGQTG